MFRCLPSMQENLTIYDKESEFDNGSNQLFLLLLVDDLNGNRRVAIVLGRFGQTKIAPSQKRLEDTERKKSVFRSKSFGERRKKRRSRIGILRRIDHAA